MMFFIQHNAFKNAVFKVMAILLHPQCVEISQCCGSYVSFIRLIHIIISMHDRELVQNIDWIFFNIFGQTEWTGAKVGTELT